MSVIFKCRYCPITFYQFKGLVKHYEGKHNPDSEPYQKLRHSTFYSSSDSGCWLATNKLGYQSSCLNCPFLKCVLDELGVGPATVKKRKRNDELVRLRREPTKTIELASMFRLSLRTVQRILKDAKTH